MQCTRNGHRGLEVGAEGRLPKHVCYMQDALVCSEMRQSAQTSAEGLYQHAANNLMGDHQHDARCTRVY